MDFETWRQQHGPVSVIVLPHNYRDELYDEHEGPSFRTYEDGEVRQPVLVKSAWATFPLDMPHGLILFTDHDGKVIAGTADGKRIPWEYLDIVVIGVREFNENCERLGIVRQPPPLLESDNDHMPRPPDDGDPHLDPDSPSAA